MLSDGNVVVLNQQTLLVCSYPIVLCCSIVITAVF